MKFADPKNDIAFKKIFGNENKREILMSFLNSVLDFKGNQEIVDLTLVNPFQIPKIEALKETILDIKARNKNNEQFIVEMQRKDLGNFAKRSLYYTSKAYVAQLDRNCDYSQLKKVYFIGILNFIIFDNKDYISRHLIINQETTQQDIKDFEFAFIELPKFKKTIDQSLSILDKWVYFIQNAGNLSMVPKELREFQEFREAFEIATQTTWSKEELEVYDYIGLRAFDEIHALETAEKKGRKKGHEEGVKEGHAEGVKEGIKEGHAEGVKEGHKEGVKEGYKEGSRQRSFEIAKNLLDVLDDETIALKSGLNMEEVRALRLEEE